MKSLKILVPALFVLTLTSIFISCKKNKDNDRKLTCRVSSFTGIGDKPVVLTYNQEGKVSRVSTGFHVVTISSDGNKKTIVTLDTGKFSQRSIVTENAAGLATNVRLETTIDGSTFFNTAFEYDGEEVSRSVATNSEGTPPVITTFTWVNHNMVSQTSDGSTITFDYFLDKPRQDGDFLFLLRTIQGFETIRSRNLIRTFATGASFTYDFNADGNIASLQANQPGSIVIVDYVYDCR
ncbi:MAG TPA: hypothetical protein VK644_14360 [Chitinophagaceae bacterium]|nr:hypothetical protein [Chitinophagaceae bacterium]